MNSLNNFVDHYYEYIGNFYGCETCERILGKHYVFKDSSAHAEMNRFFIEEGLELTKIKIHGRMGMTYDAHEDHGDILEIGYCAQGKTKIKSEPNGPHFEITAGDIFVYSVENDATRFVFEQDDAVFITIHMDCSMIQKAVNPIWQQDMLNEWQRLMQKLFEESYLVIRRSSYELWEIAEELLNITTDNMLACLKFKLKVVEFITIFFEKKWALDLQEGDKEASRELFLRGVRMIKRHRETSPSVNELIKMLHTSAFKLQNAFKQESGMTVYDYIKKERLNEARYFLEQTDWPVIDICNRVGYENPGKFAGLFKTHFGVSPLKYRRNYHEKCHQRLCVCNEK